MLVSVIIPTYNRSQFLKEAIESVLVQSYPDIEVIVVDDGSTDNTASVVPSNVSYISVENGGVSRARNIGIVRSRGEFIAFLDSDDLWLKDKLSRQVDFFNNNPDIHVCQTDEIWIRNGKRVNPKHIHKKHSGWIFEQCIPLCIVSPSAVMLNRRVFDDVGLFDEEMPVCEDYDLWLRIALKYQMVTLPEALIVKRGGHEDQLSKRWGQDVWRIHALEKVLDSVHATPEQKELAKKDIVRRAAIVVNGAKKRGRDDIVKKYLNKVSRY